MPGKQTTVTKVETKRKVSRKVCTKLGVVLFDEMRRAAERQGIPLNEWLSRVCAQYLGRPDLESVPHERMGRPRKVK